MTEFILIRHGETDANRELRFQGQVDTPLNAVGHEQARRLGLRLAGEGAHLLLSSDLTRTQQTALSISQQSQHPFTGDLRLKPALREQNFGAVDGMRAPDIQAQHPEAWAQWIRFHPDFAFDGGESTRQFHARVMASLRRLAQAHPQQTLLVVTHGGVLDMIYRTAHQLPLSGPRQSVIPNAGLNRVRMDGDAPRIVTWADTQHLGGMPAQPTYDQIRLAQRAALALEKPGAR